MKSVFFNLFFETEPFAAILIANGTRGLSQKIVLGEKVFGKWQRATTHG